MGMSGSQRFWRVELPLALPLVMSGVRLALVQVWATATIAALVAGPGVGRIIVDGFARNLYSQGIAAAIVVAVAALILEVAAAAVQRALDPVPRSSRRVRGGAMSAAGPTL
jgi:osmoprotectant transport system permease protein